MKTIFDHIEHVKGKPHHVRKRIAFSIAAGGAGLVALVWLATSLGTGAFAIRGASFADAVGGGNAITTDAPKGSQNLAGAAAALEDSSAPAHIEIIEAPSSASKKQAERTTIPF